MPQSTADTWLGLIRDDRDDLWRLPVTQGVTSGATALFGGCATAAAIMVAHDVCDQPVVWAGAHFGALAKLGAEVTLRRRTISAGRTMTHIEVVGEDDGRQAFTARVAAGHRPPHPVQGQWAHPPRVEEVSSSAPFVHPVHDETWAARFEWRVAGRGLDANADPWAAWWVRPREETDSLVVASVLCDYVTYGVGRALDEPMGGLSVDNVLRIHDPRPSSEWWLLEVRPEAINGGFGYGTARVFADGRLVATGTQTIVMNTWDWRLPGERANGGA